MQRSIDRTIGHRPTRLIVHRSLIATTSRTIAYDGSCHRYSPIVCESAITRRDQSRYATAAGDRGKNCRSVATWPNRKQSYDPEIVRFGVTVALEQLLRFFLDASIRCKRRQNIYVKCVIRGGGCVGQCNVENIN